MVLLVRGRVLGIDSSMIISSSFVPFIRVHSSSSQPRPLNRKPLSGIPPQLASYLSGKIIAIFHPPPGEIFYSLFLFINWVVERERGGGEEIRKTHPSLALEKREKCGGVGGLSGNSYVGTGSCVLCRCGIFSK